jgi:glycosyltransferase involved in cell wall biosynthesis
MKKILCLNNYDLSWFDEHTPTLPNHYLYGINYLHERGDRIAIGGGESRRFLHAVQEVMTRLHFPVPLGDLSRQWNALPEIRGADVIYTPCGSVAQILCYLRAIGVIRTPIVCLAHHPPLRGRLQLLRRPWVRLGLKGLAAFPSLSRVVASEINKLTPGRNLSTSLPWGPDLGFYPTYSPPGHGVISAGRTGRDFVTFGVAASKTGYPATIVCPSAYVTAEFKQFGPNLTVLSHFNPDHFTYSQLIAMYAGARAIAIPMMSTTGSLCGLTSLLDALAMGRAVIMTHNPFIDIDIEAEKIGLWVPPNDTVGWQKAIQFIADHPDQAEAMGQRGRCLAEERYNSRKFADCLFRIIDSASVGLDPAL